MELLTNDVVPIWVALPRAEIGHLKFVFESYEGVAIVRTWDRRAALLVVLAAPDFVEDARRILAALEDEIGCRVVDPPAPGVIDVLGPDDSEEESER